MYSFYKCTAPSCLMCRKLCVRVCDSSNYTAISVSLSILGKLRNPENRTLASYLSVLTLTDCLLLQLDQHHQWNHFIHLLDRNTCS